MVYKPGVSGNPNGRPKGTTKNKKERTTNAGLIRALKKFGADGVDALGEYLNYYKNSIVVTKAAIAELDIEIVLCGDDMEEASKLTRHKETLKALVAGYYENYYKAGGKLADLMQNMIKHEVASGNTKPNQEEPKPKQSDAPVFSTSAL